jgi:type IV secretory pathway VirB10-like protein
MDTYAAALKSSDLVSSGGSKALATALGLPGIVTASIPQTVGHYAGLYGETMPNLGQVIDDSIEKNVLGITTPDITPNEFFSTPSDWSPVAVPAGPSAADIERQNQAAINARLAQEATVRQQQQQQEAARQAQAAQASAAAEAQAARGRVAAAQEVQRFMASRAYQEEGAELTPAMMDALAAGQVDTFADIGGWAGRSPGAAIDVSDRGGGPF